MIYIDLDGVLVDFVGAVRKNLWAEFQNNATNKKELWERVKDYTKEGGKLWEEAKPMADFQILLDFLKNEEWKVLSSTGKSLKQDIRIQKLLWIERYLPAGTCVNFVENATEKSLFVHSQNDILVDDRRKAIWSWDMAGGTGVLHDGAISSVTVLEQLTELINNNKR